MTIVDRSIRLQPNQGTALNRATGQAGEIFYDVTNKTLRIYDGRTNTGSILATQTWVNENTTQLPTQTSNSGKYLTTNGTTLSWATVTIPTQVQPDWNATSGLGQILNKPSVPSLTGYATESYVTSAIGALSIPSLTGYATETYVNNAIPSLTGYATETYVDNAIPSLTGYATETYVDNAIPSLTNYATLNGAAFSGILTADNNVADGLTVTGGVVMGMSQERYVPQTISGSTSTHTLGPGYLGWSTIFNCSGQTVNFTPNIFEVPTTQIVFGTVITFTFIMNQTSSFGLPTALKLNNVSQTINWQGGLAPGGVANKIQIVTFNCFIKSTTSSNGLYTVLGSMTSFG